MEIILEKSIIYRLVFLVAPVVPSWKAFVFSMQEFMAKLAQYFEAVWIKLFIVSLEAVVDIQAFLVFSAAALTLEMFVF